MKILYRHTRECLFEAEAETLKELVEKAVKEGTDLWGADLRGADLTGVNLRGANLWRADLGGANLWGAYLRGADLGGAYLGRANLRGADLGGANLWGANLWGANLRGADLREAYLDLLHLKDIKNAVALAPYVFGGWNMFGKETVIKELKALDPDEKAIAIMQSERTGAFCYILHRREIWWWGFVCPHEDTALVLWRDNHASKNV